MWVLAVVGVGVALLGLVRPAQADARSRVAVIVMENKAYSKIVGSANAPYINSVIPQGQLFTNYFAVINGSLHNYLAMTSGLTAKQKPPPSERVPGDRRHRWVGDLDGAGRVDDRELWCRIGR